MKLKVLFLVAAIILSILIFVFRGQFVRLEGYGLFGLFVLSIIGNATIVLPVPVILTAFVGGAIFNPLWVALVVSLGATIGELTGYMAGFGGGALIEKDLRIQKVKKWMDRYGLWTIFFLAAVPNPLFDIAGIIAGATNISVYKYIPVVWAGKLIKFGIFSYLGANSIGLIDKFI